MWSLGDFEEHLILPSELLFGKEVLLSQAHACSSPLNSGTAPALSHFVQTVCNKPRERLNQEAGLACLPGPRTRGNGASPHPVGMANVRREGGPRMGREDSSLRQEAPVGTHRDPTIPMSA